MMREPVPDTKAVAALNREDRLKAALKANMGRRKAQARARADDTTADDETEKPGDATTAGNEKE